MYYWIIILTSGKVITSPNFNWILYNNSLQIQDQITSISSFLQQVGKVSPIFIPHKTLVAATPYQFSGSGFFSCAMYSARVSGYDFGGNCQLVEQQRFRAVGHHIRRSVPSHSLQNMIAIVRGWEATQCAIVLLEQRLVC